MQIEDTKYVIDSFIKAYMEDYVNQIKELLYKDQDGDQYRFVYTPDLFELFKLFCEESNYNSSNIRIRTLSMELRNQLSFIEKGEKK